MPLACCVGHGPGPLVNLSASRPKSMPRTSRWSASATWTNSNAAPCAAPASAPSPCATSTSAACAHVMRRRHRHRLATAPPASIFRSIWISSIPQYAPGVGTPVRGGATYREAHLAMEMICDSGRMLSMEVVEVNPVIDEVQSHRRTGRRTHPLRPGKEDSLNMKTRVAVVYGGRSGEHEISLRSAESVIAAMNPAAL